MPASVQNGSSSVSFADVLDSITQRLRNQFPIGDYVSVVCGPEDRLTQYQAQPGLLVYVSSPMPVPKHGAGRYGRLTIRDVTVIVMTLSLVDRAGSDEEAVKAHLAREEAVANVLEQVPPSTESYSNRIGTLIEQVEGGQDILRKIKLDPGILVSALKFRVTYQAPMKVRRD